MKFIMSLTAITFLIFSSIFSFAYADVVEDFLQQVEKYAEQDGGKFTYNLKSSNDDGDAVLTDIEIDNGRAKNVVTLDMLTLNGIERLGENGFSFDKVNAEMLKVSNKKDAELDIANISMTDVVYPDVSDRKNIAWPLNIGALSANELFFKAGDATEALNVNLPSIALTNLQHNGDDKFFLESLIVSPFSGEGTGEKNANGAFTSEGLKLFDLEYAGDFGGSLRKLEFGALSAAGVTPDQKNLEVSFAGLNADNVYTPGIGEKRPLFSKKTQNMKMGALNIALNGASIFGWESANANSLFDEATRVITSEFLWKDMFFDIETASDQDPTMRPAVQPMIDLGYGKLNTDWVVAGAWDLSADIVKIDRFNFDVKNAFEFNWAFAISGYTEALARQINVISNKMQFADPKQQEALSLQLLAILAGISINDMQIVLEDKSLLNKVIEYQAKQQNQDPEQLRSFAGPMVGIMLAPFQIPEFASSLSTALNMFMQGNKSMTLTLKPEPPASVPEIGGLFAGVNAGTVTPAEILKRFNVTVEAE